MANEITVTTNLSAVKGNLSYSRAYTARVTMATARKDGKVQTIGTAYEALTPAADLTTNGWAIFINLDATNYVEIGVEVAAAFYPAVRLNAGESALFRAAQGVTLYARANTAAVDLEWTLLHN